MCLCCAHSTLCRVTTPRATASPTARSKVLFGPPTATEMCSIALHCFVATLTQKCDPLLCHDRKPRETLSPLQDDQERDATTSKEVTTRRDQTPMPRLTRTPLPLQNRSHKQPSIEDRHRRRRHSEKGCNQQVRRNEDAIPCANRWIVTEVATPPLRCHATQRPPPR